MAKGIVKKEPEESAFASKVGASQKTSASAMKSDENRRRVARSRAPSVATRTIARGPVPTPSEGDKDDDECMLMEVRPRIKTQPEEEEPRFPNIGGPNNNNMSFISNPGFQAIGQKLKEVNDTLGTLQSLGIQRVASLPELVLVGDQSAGKSSIMSAIAGLNLPHNTGVCTRCPFIFGYLARLIRTGPISSPCSKIMPLSQDKAPRVRRTSRPRNHSPLGKSRPVRRRNSPGFRGRVDSIEHILRWAQVAILNHTHDHEQYARRVQCGSESDAQDEEGSVLSRAEAQTEAKFSPNVVALVIRGPDLPELSFYDLPGVFANARHAEDQYLSDVVKNLTREYISHDKAIILCAVPMNTDAEISTTFSIIREMRAEERCLGIMTKADLLPQGGHQQWLDILNGLVHKTGLVYFITSRLDKDLDEQAAFEEAFFNRQARHDAETPTWPLEFDIFDDRCGVVRLKEFLCQKLAEVFARSYPAVKTILQERLALVVSQLQDLSEMPENPELEIRKGLLEFTALASTCLKGQDFLGAWKTQETEFRTCILGKKPKYVVKPPTTKVIDLDSDGAVTTPDETPKRRSAANHYTDPQATPSKRRADGAPRSGGPRPGGTVKMEVTPAGLRPATFKPKTRTLEELRAIIQSKRQPGMPNSTPDAVFETLCVEAVQYWRDEIREFVRKTMILVHTEMQKALDTAFVTLKNRTAYREAKSHLNTFFKSHHETLVAQLEDAYKLERHQLYTNNNKFFEINKDYELRELARHRHYLRWLAFSGVESERPRPYDQMTDEEKSQETARMAKEAPKMGKDPFSQELEVASYVRGYYITAALRFIDNAALHMISGMFPTVAKDINMYLDKKLSLMNQPNRAIFERLMEEEPKTAELRNQLKEDKKKYEEAMASILALEMSATAAADQKEGEDDYMGIDGPHPAMMSGAPYGSSVYEDDI